MNTTIAEILKNQAEIIAEAKRLSAEAAAVEMAKRERAEAKIIESCLALLPEYLRGWAVLKAKNEYEAVFTIQIPDVDGEGVEFAPFQAEFDNLHYAPKLSGYRLPVLNKIRSDDAIESGKPEFYFVSKTYGPDFDLQEAEAAIYGAHQLGIEYQNAMIAWVENEPARRASEAARWAKAEAARLREDAEREKLIAFADLLNNDPVLKPLFEVLAAVVGERDNYREQVDNLAWAMDESESRASRRLEKARRETQRAADEARAAQSEASDAEERARKAEKKLKAIS